MLHLDKYKMQLSLFFVIIEPDILYFFLGHCIIPILWIQSFIKAEMVKKTFCPNFWLLIIIIFHSGKNLKCLKQSDVYYSGDISLAELIMMECRNCIS